MYIQFVEREGLYGDKFSTRMKNVQFIESKFAWNKYKINEEEISLHAYFCAGWVKA